MKCSWADQVMLDLYLSAQVATGAMWHVESRGERLVDEKSMMVHRVGRTVGWRYICAIVATISCPGSKSEMGIDADDVNCERTS